MTAPTFTCPRCRRTSHNPNDVREGYCGACHDWTAADAHRAPAMSAQERRDRDLIARHLRAAASAVNVADWPAYLRSVADGHADGASWYRP